MILCLDLSYSNTGYSLFYENGKFKCSGSITPPKKSTNLKAMLYIYNNVVLLFNKYGITQVVIEDVYVGRNKKVVISLSRLSGSILGLSMLKLKRVPVLISAVKARSDIGIDGSSKKPYIQLHILELFKMVKYSIIKKYRKDLDRLTATYCNEKVSKSQYTYRLSKISKDIAKTTGLNNDEADSIVLGLAYIKKREVWVA